MRNLLRANFSRLWKSRIFWLEILFMFGLACFIVWNQYDELTKYNVVVTLDRPLFLAMSLFGVVAAVFVSLFVGVEYSDGTIRNKLAVGRDRSAIYLTSFVACAASLMAAYTLSVLTALGLGLLLFDPPTVPVKLLWTAYGIGLAMSLAYAGIFNLIAMLCSNKTYTAIVSILLAFGLMIAATYCENRLQQPEFVQQLAPITESTDESQITDAVTADGEYGQMALETVPNLNYVSGAARERIQFFQDVNPTGQALELTNLDFVHPVRIALYDLGIVLLTGLAGLAVFRRKDIK